MAGEHESVAAMVIVEDHLSVKLGKMAVGFSMVQLAGDQDAVMPRLGIQCLQEYQNTSNGLTAQWEEIENS